MSARSGAEFRLTAMAAAVLAAGAALADERDNEIARLKRPDSEASVGGAYVSDDNTRFGQYNGMTDKGLYLLLDADVRRRDDATGTWLNFRGRNLGLDNRDLRFENSKQGDWGYFIDFSQTPRHSPYTALTGLTGFDSTTQTVNGQLATTLDLKTERKALTAGVDKWVSTRWDLHFSVRQEEKTGRQLFGRSGTDFLVNPIDYKTQIYEATVGYVGDKAQLTGGYFGTNFTNHKDRLDIIGGTGTGFSPIALPPDNESHQLYVSGGYALNPTTRATYKLSYQHQTQDAQFIDVSSTGRTSLGGVVDTKFGQVGLTARPMPRLSVVADFRKENRDDKTPIVDYFNFTTTNTATGVNEPRTIHSTVGKLEGTYQLAAQLRLTGGYDYEEKKRNTSDVRIVSYRETTQENTLRVELRRALSETLNGSIGYGHSSRTGSDWQTTTTTNGAPGSNLVQPLYLADRDRDKLRITGGWTPSDKLDFQARLEASRDDYSGRTLGLQDGSARFASIDAAWRFAENWQASAWLSHDETKANLLSCMSAASSNNGDISACPNTAASPIWSANLRNIGDAIGIGVRGKPTGQLEVGADFTLSNDRAEFRNGPTPVATPPLTPPPDVSYNRSVLKLTAKYALLKNSGVRFQYIHDKFSTNDWTWDTWTYADGTRILSNSQQRVDYFGASYYISF